MAFSHPAVHNDFRYDPDEHYAPPIRIKWMTRSKKLSIERWVFVQCCGQTEKVRSDIDGRIISSLHRCKPSGFLRTTLKHHSGSLVLKRHTHSAIIKHTPPLAQWSCCRAIIPSWNDSWDSRDRKIPFPFVDTGCKTGRYNQDGAEEDSSGDLDDYFNARLLSNVALVARPIHRRSKGSSGKSSGDQTLVLGKSCVDPRNVEFTQNTVERSFSNGRRILDVMVEIFKGQVNIEDNIPEIRVAERGGKLYSVDNRRLLMFKVLRLDEVNVTRIMWTSEFDSKLRQCVLFDPRTRIQLDKKGIAGFREELTKRIFEENDEEISQEKIPLYIPSSCAGYVIGSSGNTIKSLREKYAAEIIVQDLGKLRRKHPVPEFTDVVAIRIWEKKEEKRSRPQAARAQILKMVAKLIERDGGTRGQGQKMMKRKADKLICNESEKTSKRHRYQWEDTQGRSRKLMKQKAKKTVCNEGKISYSQTQEYLSPSRALLRQVGMMINWSDSD